MNIVYTLNKFSIYNFIYYLEIYFINEIGMIIVYLCDFAYSN